MKDGQIVNVLRGCDGPLITKMISLTKDKERKIAEGIIERVTVSFFAWFVEGLDPLFSSLLKNLIC